MVTEWQGFGDILAGRPQRRAPQAPNALEGKILAVDATAATFTIPEWDPTIKFSAAPFLAGPTPPAPGDRCLVLFVGNGIDRPWIVSWTPAS